MWRMSDEEPSRSIAAGISVVMWLPIAYEEVYMSQSSASPTPTASLVVHNTTGYPLEATLASGYGPNFQKIPAREFAEQSEEGIVMFR